MRCREPNSYLLTSQVVLVVKNLPARAETGVRSGSGRSPGEDNDNPLQYSCLEDPMERKAWQATVHGVSKRSGTTECTRRHTLHHLLTSACKAIATIDSLLLNSLHPIFGCADWCSKTHTSPLRNNLSGVTTRVEITKKVHSRTGLVGASSTAGGQCGSGRQRLKVRDT